MIKYSINEKDCQGKRLDKFLAAKFLLSRALTQTLIKNKGVLVNGKDVKPHYSLKEGDEIVLDEKKLAELKEAKKIDLSPFNSGITSEKSRNKNLPFWQIASKGLEIIYQDENFLVINKPAGLISHPSPTHPKETLINILLNSFPEIKNVGDDKIRPGIVHRLDKEASGLLAIAKTQQAFAHLKKQFQNRLVEKEYLVLVCGKVKDEKGEIALPIGRLPKRGYKMTAGYFPKAKPARTEYEVVKYFEASAESAEANFTPRIYSRKNPQSFAKADQNYTLLRVKTKTGRTHQIRVHLKSLGYPVVGDKVYGSKKQEKKDLKRLFLHCYKLSFMDLADKKQGFEIDLPKDLKDFLKQLTLAD